MNPIPAKLHAPSGIVTYTDSLDWRSQISTGNIPRDPQSLSRFWVDTAAVRRLSQIEHLKYIIPGFSAPEQSKAYTCIARSFTPNGIGTLRRVTIGSPNFFNTYAPSMAHNEAVQTMVEYKWVFELQGQPPMLTTLVFPESIAAVPNFEGKDPHYPLELRPDHIYFPIGEDLYALPIRDFILRFQVNTKSYSDMRAAVLTLAQDSGLSDEQAISMIRLAVQEKPSTPPVI